MYTRCFWCSKPLQPQSILLRWEIDDMTRAELELSARDRGYTVREVTQETFFPAFGRSEQVTFFVIMDGEKVVRQFTEARLKHVEDIWRKP